MFLNPLMLVAAGAAVLPVVIHLLSRSRYRSVDWGAMMFLDGADANRERRSRLRQWLLLAVRWARWRCWRSRWPGRSCGAGSARGRRAEGHGGHPARLLAEHGGRGERPLADGPGRAAARQVLALHRGDRVAVVLMGREQPDAEREPTADLWDVGRRIDAAEPGYRRATSPTA